MTAMDNAGVSPDRLYLGLYAAAVLAASLVHRSEWLAGMLAVSLLLCGRDLRRLLLKAVKAVLVFNLAVGVGYAALALWRGDDPWPTLLLINLRVLLLTLLGFLLLARVNLFCALAFSRTLSYLLGLAYSQALTFRRAHDDFRLALISRSPLRPSLADRYRASAAAVSWFMDKAQHNSRETAQALRARGFFDA
jgi:cobalt/nickel transport system permease protein